MIYTPIDQNNKLREEEKKNDECWGETEKLETPLIISFDIYFALWPQLIERVIQKIRFDISISLLVPLLGSERAVACRSRHQVF